MTDYQSNHTALAFLAGVEPARPSAGRARYQLARLGFGIPLLLRRDTLGGRVSVAVYSAEAPHAHRVKDWL